MTYCLWVRHSFLLFSLLIITAASWVVILWYPSAYDHTSATRTLLDRHGEFLGAIAPAHGGRQQWTPLEKIPTAVIDATLKAEDRFYFWHPGVNPIAIVKAAYTNLRHGKIKRGGSTITQQLAKLMLEDGNGAPRPRSIVAKISATLLALGLEIRHSKSWILERYLNTAYYGERCYGITAAAKHYFGRQLRALTLAEIAVLARLPRSPGHAARIIPGARPPTTAFITGRHFTDTLIKLRPREELLTRTTLDLTAQRAVEETLGKVIASQAEKDPRLNAAVVAIDVASGDVLALAGSRGYFDALIDGQFNAATALRQPGSTLKPFTYFAAFAKGYGAATRVEDAPANFATADSDSAYMPQNFDRRFHGLVSIREALANSYNVPAVATLNSIGLSYYHDMLREFGFTTLGKPPLHYGLAITLGAGEVTLLELTNAYAALARGGKILPYRLTAADPLVASRPVITGAERYAAMITAIISDPNVRRKTFGYNDNLIVDDIPVAVKTGTSYELRDNWTVGYTPDLAVGVWVGHNDGTPLNNTTGATGAAPLWHAIMEKLARRREPADAIRQGKQAPTFTPPPRTSNDNRVIAKSLASNDGFRIIAPLTGTRYRAHPHLPADHQEIRAEAEILSDSVAALSWTVDGEFMQTTPVATSVTKLGVWLNPDPGEHTLEVATDNGRSQKVRYYVSAP